MTMNHLLWHYLHKTITGSYWNYYTWNELILPISNDLTWIHITHGKCWYWWCSLSGWNRQKFLAYLKHSHKYTRISVKIIQLAIISLSFAITISQWSINEPKQRLTDLKYENDFQLKQFRGNCKTKWIKFICDAFRPLGLHRTGFVDVVATTHAWTRVAIFFVFKYLTLW